MSLLNFRVQAEVAISFDGNTLKASTDQVGVAGLRGCGIESATAVTGYVFELQTINTSENSCNVGNRKGWRMISKQATNEPSAVFNNLENGTYRVLCKIGKSIGCAIVNAPAQIPSHSIVYEIEKSESTENILNEAILKVNEGIADALGVFPNPSSGHVQVILRNHDLRGVTQLVLFDVLGEEVLTIKKKVENTLAEQWELDLEDLAEGAYFINIGDNKGRSYSGKVILHRK